MPHLKSAFKNLRKSKKRAEENLRMKGNLSRLLKKPVTPKTIPQLFKAIDKAAKRKIISKERAARMKSSLSKKLKGA